MSITATDAVIPLFVVWVLIPVTLFLARSYHARPQIRGGRRGDKGKSTRASDLLLVIIGLASLYDAPVALLASLLLGGTVIHLFFHTFNAPTPCAERASGILVVRDHALCDPEPTIPGSPSLGGIPANDEVTAGVAQAGYPDEAGVGRIHP